MEIIVSAKLLSTISTKMRRICDNMLRHGGSFTGNPTVKQMKNIADYPIP